MIIEHQFIIIIIYIHHFHSFIHYYNHLLSRYRDDTTGVGIHN